MRTQIVIATWVWAVSLALGGGVCGAEQMLVAEWKFDEGTGAHAGDTAGHNHGGTLTSRGDPSAESMWSEEGAAGGSLALNGVDQCVVCEDDAELSLSGAFTIQAWVKPDAGCVRDAALLGKLGGGYTGYDFLVSADYAGFRYGNSAGKIEAIAFGQRPRPGVWSHVAVTKEGNALTTYLNGALDKTFELQDPGIAGNDRPLVIGCNRWNDKYYKGLIDEVRIYNYARGAEEILADVKRSPLAGELSAPAARAPAFDFSKTEAAKHLPADYFEKHVQNKEGYAGWIAAYRELQGQLAAKQPLSDEELFAEHIDLSFPGLEATREAFQKGDTAGARKAFTAFFMKRFPQKEPEHRDISDVTGWDRKVVGWCEGYLAGKIGPLRSSGEYYTLAPGERFDYRGIDPIGLNNYDWGQIGTWLQPVRHYIEGYAATGKKAYLSEAVRIINGWYDGFAGQGRANCELLTFDREGRFRQGNLADAAIEFSHWSHWPVAEGRNRTALALAPYVSQTEEPEALVMRMTEMMVEDLGLMANRLPHYWGNFSNIVANDLCKTVVPFAFLAKAPEWFDLAYETGTKNYATDSFPDGATKDLTEAYMNGYLNAFSKTWEVVDEYQEHDRFKMDREAFAKERGKSFEWVLYTAMPDLSPATFNDCYRRRGMARDVVTEPLRQLDWCGREDLRWLATERAEGTPPEHVSYPFSTHAPSWAGVYAMRSGWDQEAVYLGVDFGPYGGAHGHPDYGSINIFAYGNDLIVDPACGVYGQPLHYKVDKAPQTHNAIMIDGVGQHVGKNEARPDWFTEPIRTWVTNRVLDAAWGTYRFPNGLAHERTVWFARPDYFLVVDTLTGEGRHTVRQNWTLAPYYRPEVEGSAVRTQKKRLANILIAPADDRPAPDIVKGRTEPMYEGWVMWDNPQERMPAPAAVYSFEAAFPAGLETVLYPTPGGVEAEVSVTRKKAKEDTGAVLVTVTTPKGVDRFVVARREGRHAFPDEGIVFEGRMAAIRSIEGKATSIGMLGGRLLEAAGVKVSADAPADAALELVDGAWAVRDSEDAIKVTGR